MPKYRKLPVVIEAYQWTGDNLKEILDFINLPPRNEDGTHNILANDSSEGPLFIYTLEGTMEASVGDYIIKGVAGEFYPCREDIFLETYEEVTYEEVTEDERPD